MIAAKYWAPVDQYIMELSITQCIYFSNVFMHNLRDEGLLNNDQPFNLQRA
jgi:leucyl-tRNA synthetase